MCSLLRKICLKYTYLYIQKRSCFPHVSKFTCVRNKIDLVIKIENTQIQQQKTISMHFFMLPFSFKIPVVSMMMSVCYIPSGTGRGSSLNKVCTGMRESQRQHPPFKCIFTIQWV